MTLPPDILVRVGAAVVSVILLRDAYSAFQGRRLLITKGYSTMIFDGWKSRVVGVFLVLCAIGILLIAWSGL